MPGMECYMKPKKIIAYILVVAIVACLLPLSAYSETQQPRIVDNRIIGTFDSPGDSYKSYDKNISTKWNPKLLGYGYGAGIIYELDGYYDLTQIVLTMDSRYYYFDLYASNDGEIFSEVASVTAENQSSCYLDGYVCTLSDLTVENARYIKLVFTGAIDNSVWVNLYEVELTGQDAFANETNAGIANSVIEGGWKSGSVMTYAYDNDLATKWNPQASDYESGEGITFCLREPTDMDALRIVFEKRFYYFTVAVSTNGSDYIQVAAVDSANKDFFYSDDYICTVAFSAVLKAQYVRLTFTGSSDSGLWVNFYEISIYEAKHTDVEQPDEPQEQPVMPIPIIDSSLSGKWIAEGNRSLGYDGDVGTKWNPQSSGYQSSESIVFRLDDTYQMSEIRIVFDRRYYYFDISVSEEGISFFDAVSVTAENQQQWYTDGYICTIADLSNVRAKYVKLTFTGSSDGNAWINFMEIACYGRKATSMPVKASVKTATIEGQWRNYGDVSKAYDGDVGTRWNPLSNGFQSEESVVFTLDRAYDLTKLQITFGARYHYFTIFASEDAENFVLIADVNASNYEAYYLTDYVCTVDNLTEKDIRYIKIQFHGNSSASRNDYVNFDEIQIEGYCVLVSQWNVVLEDDLAVRFLTCIPEKTDRIQVNVGEDVVLYSADELEEVKHGFYLVSVHIAAAQMTTPITVRLLQNGLPVLSESYTLRQYVDVLLADINYSQLHPLLREMLSYGSATQSYFSYCIEDLADQGVMGAGLREIPIADPQEMTVSGSASGVAFYGASLVFQHRISLRFYFSSINGSFMVNGESCTPVQQDGLYLIEVEDILPQDLDEQCTVTATDENGQVLTVCYSPMNYVYRMMQKGSDSLKHLLKALYNYHLAAESLRPDSIRNVTFQSGATDALGREVTPANRSDSEKEVGVFYFLWLGTGGDYLHDVSEILKNDPNAAISDAAWQAAGGGGTGMVHWWGESIFGHYFSVDSWVIERDVMMLTDAGVDFLAVDYSNSSTFPQQLLVLLKALDKYYRQGYDVPKVTFITKSNTGAQVMNLYANAYLAYPQYSHLWYQMSGKPMIVGNESDEELSEACREYFTFLYAQWPRESYQENGFPWMDFGWWTENGKQAVFKLADGRTMMNVSVAQHSGTLAFSSSAFYGDTTNHTRSWHDGANDPAEDAYLYGYNFAEQFDYAITQNPDIVFITGWNEWIAGRQNQWTGIDGEITDPIIMVDNADINNSRDIQPMLGGYGDNYYMQMISYIRRFKGQQSVNVGLNTQSIPTSISIDIHKNMTQWASVGSYYLDYLRDTEDRNCPGYGGIRYENVTGRNDIYLMKLTNDSQYLYAYVRTAQPITGADAGQCLTMFISTGSAENWCGYDYVIGRTSVGVVEKRTSTGWQVIGTVDYSLTGSELQFAVPLSAIGLSAGDFSLQFKFVDNYQTEDDINAFYLNGDSAPYGRLNYIYESVSAAD